MGLTGKLNSRLTQTIGQNTEMFSPEKLEEIEYGINIFFSNLANILVILAFACCLGILKLTVVCMISFGLLRGFAGGVHAHSSLGCLISSGIIYFGIVYLALNFPVLKAGALLILTVDLLLIYKYAPADVPEKPIAGKNHRRQLRKLAGLSAVFLYAIAILQTDSAIAAVIMYSSLVECVTLTPLIYRITKKKRGDFREEKV